MELSEEGKARGEDYVEENGVEQFQPAEVVIMACNGVGTPRILWKSQSERHHDGLGNR